METSSSGCGTLQLIQEPESAAQESIFQWILISWILFVLLATFLASSLDSEWLHCFSVSENAANILSRENSGREEHEFLFGYRFVYLCVACAMHVFELQIFWSPLAIINIATYHSQHSWFLKMTAAHFNHSMGSSFVWAGELCSCLSLSLDCPD